MSDATERPAAEPPEGPDAEADAWARACAEDLAAERARLSAQSGARPGSAAEELRKLVDAVADKLSSLQDPFSGTAAAGAIQQVIAQAKAAVEPVVERNPEVFGHLAAAGSELLAAYRAAVEREERHRTRGDEQSGKRPEGDDDGLSGTERTGLD